MQCLSVAKHNEALKKRSIHEIIEIYKGNYFKEQNTFVKFTNTVLNK